MDLGGGCRGCTPPAFCKKKTMWFISVEVEQETSAPPPKENPGCAPVYWIFGFLTGHFKFKVTGGHLLVKQWFFFFLNMSIDNHVK